jgi:hypothetical protein
MKRLPIIFGALAAAFMLAALAVGSGRHAAAQATVPDFTQLGFPQVIGTVTYTPGMTVTLTGGTQEVVLPDNFISKTVKFELLQGDPTTFAASLPITDQGRTIIVAWAFRVTDVATNQLVGRFDNPVQWSVTDPRIAAGSAVYNTSAASPPMITANAAPGTIAGTKLSHPFGGAGVGWLVLGPPGAAQPTAVASETAGPVTQPTAVATTAPTEVPTAAPPSGGGAGEPTPEATLPPIGMPNTGGSGMGPEAALLVMAAMAAAVAGVMMRRRRVS